MLGQDISIVSKYGVACNDDIYGGFHRMPKRLTLRLTAHVTQWTKYTGSREELGDLSHPMANQCRWTNNERERRRIAFRIVRMRKSHSNESLQRFPFKHRSNDLRQVEQQLKSKVGSKNTTYLNPLNRTVRR